MFTDSHTHLYLDAFSDDRDAVVERALREGVERMYLPNIDRSTIAPMMALCQAYPRHCFPMLGLHPTSVGEDHVSQLEAVEAALVQHKAAAVGEIGIDLYWDKTYQEAQEQVFKRQLEMAREMNLPVVIHARDSFEEIFRVMDQVWDPSLRGVFHSFTGGSAELEKIGQYRFMVGINGIVTFKNAGLAEVARQIPMEKLLLETDAPFLAPVPHRGKRNESAYLVKIAEKMASLYDMNVDSLAETTTENALNLFKLH